MDSLILTCEEYDNHHIFTLLHHGRKMKTYVHTPAFRNWLEFFDDTYTKLNERYNELGLNDRLIVFLDAQAPLVPLAMHVITLKETSEQKTSRSCVDEPKKYYEQMVRTRIFKNLYKLHYLGLFRDALCEIKENPTTTVPGFTNSTVPLSSLTDISMDVIALNQFQKTNDNELKAVLKSIDTLFSGFNNSCRCITWIAEDRNGSEYVFPPFFTCIPKKDFHVMMYTYVKPTRPRCLKVVLGDYLMDVPLDIQVPDTMDALNVTVIVVPNITPDSTEIIGADIVLYNDVNFDLPLKNQLYNFKTE